MITLKPLTTKLNELFKKMVKLLPQVVAAEMRAIASDVVADLEGTAATWEDQPTFDVKSNADGSQKITTEHRVWNWVDQGTAPHTIVPKRAEFLRFNVPYSPATRPGSLKARNAKTGKKTVRTRVVFHPGIEPRQFSVKILRVWDPRIPRRISKKLDEGIEAVGL